MKGLRVLCVLLLAAAACSQLTDAGARGEVRVEATGSALRLTNETAQPVYYTAFERGFLALALWAPCTDPRTCDAVRPGESATIGYDAIGGYEPGAREAVVYWWHLRPKAGGGFEPDSIRSVIVGL